MSTCRSKMRLSITGFLLALVWMNADLALANQRSRNASEGRCYAVRVGAISAPAAETRNRRRYRRSFSAQELLDLRLSVWLPAGNNASVVNIRLYTPTGRLYQTLQATADASTSGEVNYRGRRIRVVSARLPVAGSHITDRSLYGEWRADAFLDGSENSCTRRPKRFTIDP